MVSVIADYIASMATVVDDNLVQRCARASVQQGISDGVVIGKDGDGFRIRPDCYNARVSVVALSALMMVG